MLTLSEEQKFHLIFTQGRESSWEREFQETKVPGSESSSYLQGVLLSKKQQQKCATAKPNFIHNSELTLLIL